MCSKSYTVVHLGVCVCTRLYKNIGDTACRTLESKPTRLIRRSDLETYHVLLLFERNLSTFPWISTGTFPKRCLQQRQVPVHKHLCNNLKIIEGSFLWIDIHIYFVLKATLLYNNFHIRRHLTSMNHMILYGVERVEPADFLFFCHYYHNIRILSFVYIAGRSEIDRWGTMQ